ncbi:MAG: YeeE/YedE family protein [Saprospiraceae bacterium]|nr:MAG: YeeE/YedE family protein [Saprospiraceae bacterium]
MIFPAIIIGFAYGYVSVKGQFCMNSGFSSVTRKKDTTKLKSYILAILIQIVVLPALFSSLTYYEPANALINNIHLPPLYLVGNVLGGFSFGIFMHYTAGCGAGIFYKIGEKNSGAVFAVAGFITGVYVLEKGSLAFVKKAAQSFSFSQNPIWQFSPSKTTTLIAATMVSALALVLISILLRKADNKPGGAVWGWKKTGFSIGVLGVSAWMSAILSHTPYGMSVIPGAIDMVDLSLSWGLLFVLGIPLGAFWSSRKKEKHFTLPKPKIIGERLAGGFGLGASASMAAGCTVGHGLTFAPLLGIGSIVSIVFIFLGSALMGYLTRK